jgi:hypothetical protein
LSLRPERGFGGLAGAASAAVLAATLAAAMLTLFPAAAGAQTRDESATSVVVRPGDSLWSISEGRLGPNASPRRVMNCVQRIHALNRARIGADPHLVLVGEELSIPRAMSGPPNGATVPARKAAEASGPDPRERAAKGLARKGAPREASGQGDVTRSGVSPEEADGMLGANTEAEVNLPDPRAATPVPAARTIVPGEARPSSFGAFLRTAHTELASAASALVEPFFGDAPDARTEKRRLLGLGIMALSLVIPVFVALAAARGAARREARGRELWFRETYGSPYASLDPFASREDAPRRAPEVRDRSASSDSPKNADVSSEDRSNHSDPSAVARAKRARVLRRRPPGLRRQPPRLRARGSRRPVRGGAFAPRRPPDGLPRGHARRKEWEPDAALVRALEGLPLSPGTDPHENLAGLGPHLGEALGALERLERLRGLSEREATRREALRALRAAVERGG